MKTLRFLILDKHITRQDGNAVVAGAVNHYEIQCVFDADWEGLTKTLVLENGDAKVELLYTGGLVLPWEVCREGGLTLSVRGTRTLADGRTQVVRTARMTKPIPVEPSGAGSGEAPAGFTPELAGQVLEKIGDLSTLNTLEKQTLTAAINEAYSHAGVSSVEFKETDETGANIYTITLSNGQSYEIAAQRGPEGKRGETGQKGADGKDGVTPTIGANGNWHFGATDTGKPSRGAQGEKGNDGVTPTIGANGNWYLGSTDTGKPSKGAKGDTGARGPSGERGATGKQGETGKGLTILGYYASQEALTAAVTSPAAGDAYGIGTAEPYDIYVWDGVGSKWVNNGSAVGVEGNYLAKDGPTGTGDLILQNCDNVRINWDEDWAERQMYSKDWAHNSFSFGNISGPDRGYALGNCCVAFHGVADGDHSFALGGDTDLGAPYSFAGPSGFARGPYSQAFGYMNRANGTGQMVIGFAAPYDSITGRKVLSSQYDCGHYLFMIGNGTSVNDRSTALTVDWAGTLWAAGSLEGGAVVLRSSTPGSEKRFVVTVDDDGALHVEDASVATRILTLDIISGHTVQKVVDVATNEEITAMEGQEYQYQVKFGHSYRVYVPEISAPSYRFVDNVTSDLTLRC